MTEQLNESSAMRAVWELKERVSAQLLRMTPTERVAHINGVAEEMIKNLGLPPMKSLRTWSKPKQNSQSLSKAKAIPSGSGGL